MNIRLYITLCLFISPYISAMQVKKTGLHTPTKPNRHISYGKLRKQLPPTITPHYAYINDKIEKTQKTHAEDALKKALSRAKPGLEKVVPESPTRKKLLQSLRKNILDAQKPGSEPCTTTNVHNMRRTPYQMLSDVAEFAQVGADLAYDLYDEGSLQQEKLIKITNTADEFKAYLSQKVAQSDELRFKSPKKRKRVNNENQDPNIQTTKPKRQRTTLFNPAENHKITQFFQFKKQDTSPTDQIIPQDKPEQTPVSMHDRLPNFRFNRSMKNI